MLNFDPTTDTQDIIIPLINDDIMEPNEVFSLSLMLTGEKENINIAMDTSFITISDDDGKLELACMQIRCIFDYIQLVILESSKK